MNPVHKFPYKWNLKNAKFTKDKGKVFSCFAGGGGSTMGYKLAGFDVIGCNEIDPKMMQVYIKNHNPKYSFLEPIQEFKNRISSKKKAIKKYGSKENIKLMGGYSKVLFPKKLYKLDILDGSPPCSSFSMTGNREKDWGKKKKFREGQVKQVLDDLFFHFIDLAKELQPKIVIAENVKGLLMGNAMGYKINYVNKIYKQLDSAGYICQHWLLDASTMGVPQRRERVFFIALRKDLVTPFLINKGFFNKVPKLKLIFNEPDIIFRDIYNSGKGKLLKLKYLKYWKKTNPGNNFQKAAKGSWFSKVRLSFNKPLPTITGHSYEDLSLPHIPNKIDYESLIIGGTFPTDYIFNTIQPGYIIGMSVPPIMIAQIVTKIYNQWISKFKNNENKQKNITKSTGNSKTWTRK